MKKAIRISITVIQLLLVCACLYLPKLAAARMGVMRHMLFTNRKYLSLYPLDQFILGVEIVCGLAVLLGVVVYFYRSKKGRPLSKGFFLNMLALIVAVAFMIFFTQVYSVNELVVYYYLLLGLAIVIILQLLKLVFLAIK